MRPLAQSLVVWLKFAAYAGAVMLLVLMVMSVLDVTQRTLDIAGVLGTLERIEVWQVIPIFLGLGYAELTGSHVSTTLVTSRLKPRTAQIVRACSMAVYTAFAILATCSLTERAIEATIAGEFRFGVAAVPVWPSRIGAALGVASLAVLCLLKLVDRLRELADRLPYLPEPDENAGVIA